MEVVTICGSLKYKDKMMNICEKLSLDGYCVLTPIFFIRDDINITDSQLVKLKDAHLKRIELSDFIFVLDIDGYIGDSTKLEIEYALSLKKKVRYYSRNDII